MNKNKSKPKLVPGTLYRVMNGGRGSSKSLPAISFATTRDPYWREYYERIDL
jgi:hypothetical protein